MSSLASLVSPTSFQQLVPEIKLEIIQLAARKTRGGHKINWKMARSLSLVNKELHCLTRPMLFEHLDLSHKTNPELETFFTEVSLDTQQLIREIVFKGKGPGYQGNNFRNPGVPAVAARRRALATRIIAQLPGLLSLDLTLDHDATSFTGLEIISALAQDIGQRLTQLEIRPEPKEEERKRQVLDPELIASILNYTPNLVLLSLEDVGLGGGINVWTTMANLHQLQTLKLESVDFPPLLPSVEWPARIKHLECWNCPGIDTSLLMKFTSYFSSTLESLDAGSRDLYEDQSAFYDLPHLKHLRLTAYQPFDHLISFKSSPLTDLVLYPVDHFLATKARVPLAQSLSHFESTLEVLDYDEDLVDTITMKDLMDVIIMRLKRQQRLLKRSGGGCNEEKVVGDAEDDAEEEQYSQLSQAIEMFPPWATRSIPTSA